MDFEKLIEEQKQKEEAYSDKSFPPTSSALSWKDYRLGTEMKWEKYEVKFERIESKFDDSYTLWGKEGIKASHAIQGEIGNCFLVAGI